MERELEVHLELTGGPIFVGRLWAHVRGSKESCSFEYDAAWLGRRDAFALDPELPLSAGVLHTHRPLFNAFRDPAPDRWGQTLLLRHERASARQERRAPRTLFTVDFLIAVHDEARLGALRFKKPGADAPFLTTAGRRIPPLIELPKLLAATTRIVAEEERDADLQLVLAPGTSLGGARPKATVRDEDGHLMIAKFPRRDDDWPVTRWEALALALAEAAALAVPPWRLVSVARRPVLVLHRFDRRSGASARVPYQSAVTALGADDRQPRAYEEIAEALRREGAEVQRDLRQLWRRMVFNILVSNTDDHLRNHGFLRDRRGWRLAPAFDLNPTPVDVKPRVHALAIAELDATASLDSALAVAPRFGLAAAEARAIAGEVGRSVARWRTVATTQGLKPREVERMESAFEHDDLRAALSMV